MYSCEFHKIFGNVINVQSSGNHIYRCLFHDIIGRAITLNTNDGIYENTVFFSRQIMSGDKNVIRWCSFLRINTLDNRGSLYISAESQSLEVDHLLFAHCYSTSGCSGLFSFSKEGVISYCCFENCSSTYVDSSGNGGNSLCVYDSTMSNISSCCLVNCGHLYSFAHGAMNIVRSGVFLSLNNFTKCRGRTSVTYCSALVINVLKDFSLKNNVFQGNLYGSCITDVSTISRTHYCSIFCNNTSSDIGLVYFHGTTLYFLDSSFYWNDKYIYYQRYSESKISFTNSFFDISSSFASSYQSHQFTNCVFNSIKTPHNLVKTVTEKCVMFVDKLDVLTKANRFNSPIFVCFQLFFY